MQRPSDVVIRKSLMPVKSEVLEIKGDEILGYRVGDKEMQKMNG